nr:hypothetical protein [uncultured Rhodopila sp.]
MPKFACEVSSIRSLAVPSSPATLARKLAEFGNFGNAEGDWWVWATAESSFDIGSFKP